MPLGSGRVGSDNLGYGPGSGFSFEPVQTSSGDHRGSEGLIKYGVPTNCSGSSEAGSTEQMCSLTSFSKHLLKMGVRATGLQSLKHVI